MTEIEHKVQTIRKYIHHHKGVDIVNIKLTDQMDIDKLNYAYNYIRSK